MRRRFGFELVIVAIIAFAFLGPGLNRYSLVDPWETHYSEVGRRMLQDNDWIHTQWQKEGFRSKPVLTFWLVAASLKAHGIAADGGYSGEIVENHDLLGAVRLPFVLFGVMGLVMIWLMLAKLVSRRVAWIGIAVVGSTPFYALISRQSITDITLVGCMMGAIATFALATEDADQPVSVLARWRWAGRQRWQFDARHLWVLIVGAFLLWQAAYHLLYFWAQPALAPGLRFPVPGVVIAVLIGLLSLGMWSLPYRALGLSIEQSSGWRATKPAWWQRVFGMERITTMRQVYILWCYTFLGVSVLGKGPAAIGILGVVAFFYIALTNRWQELLAGKFEIKRGLFLLLALVVPWHLGMYLKEGIAFLQEYFVTHLINRAGAGVDNEKGTFNYYVSQIGYGMFVWAALLPVALGSLLKVKPSTARGRVQLLIGIWAITCVGFFCIIQTKFHHYILPSVPALALLIAFWLDDLWAARVRFHPMFALLGIGIVLLVTRDMMQEEKQWIEMFVFRYDRPWPSAAPWSIDSSDGFLVLGVVGALAIAFLAWRSNVSKAPGSVANRFAIIALLASGLSVGLWAMHIYMPIAGTHWGMREAMRTYYERRQIYGERVVYFGAGQAAEDWAGVGNTRTLRTMIPDHLQQGQPMSIRLQINGTDAATERRMYAELIVAGIATSIGDHDVQITLQPAQRTEIDNFIKRAGGAWAGVGQRPPVKIVDADRLIIWQGYWRGEVFWSGDEIYGWLPETQTDWQLGDPDSKKMLKFLADPTLAPAGRRYFVLTSGNISGLSGLLQNPKARASVETLNTTSNKFSLGVFDM
jgi:4-amino-4-deoxy-L-arabinose transferase-like glycosyltransferase